MELILLQDVEKVGRKGEVVKVRDGFARNFLFPKKVAIPLTWAGKQFVDEQKARALKRAARQKAEAETLAKKLSDLKLVFKAASGDQDKLFGSVTAEDVSRLLSEQGFGIDKKNVSLKEPIRSLGTYTIGIEVFSLVKTSIQLEVVRKD